MAERGRDYPSGEYAITVLLEVRRLFCDAATNTSELFNRYAQWVAFGSYEIDLSKLPAPLPFELPDRLRPPSSATPSAVAV